jgi:hypothetical protein
MVSKSLTSGDSQSTAAFCDWLHTIHRAEIPQLSSPSTPANGTFFTQNALPLSTPHSIRDLVRNGECHFSQASLSMNEDRTAARLLGAYASLVNGDSAFGKLDISAAELLSFSIAQSAELFFESDLSSRTYPPVLAPTPVSIRAQPSPARPLDRGEALYEQQNRSGILVLWKEAITIK